jgi:hypothetical protein
MLKALKRTKENLYLEEFWGSIDRHLYKPLEYPTIKKERRKFLLSFFT